MVITNCLADILRGANNLNSYLIVCRHNSLSPKLLKFDEYQFTTRGANDMLLEAEEAGRYPLFFVIKGTVKTLEEALNV